MLVDSHCHLDRLDLSHVHGDFSHCIRDAVARDVGHMLCVSINLEKYGSMRKLVEGYREISVSVGVHPTEEHCQEPSPDTLLKLAEDPKVVAIGETGLDYYRCEEDSVWQQERFRNHVRAARAAGLPLIIHTRQARQDTLRILQEEQAGDVGGVLHCFTEDWDTAQRAMDMGFYISFSGILTFRNADSLREIAQKMPEDRILIETDSPYLAPIPMRGKPNYPEYVRFVAESMATLRKVDVGRIAEITTHNFHALFPRAATV